MIEKSARSVISVPIGRRLRPADTPLKNGDWLRATRRIIEGSLWREVPVPLVQLAAKSGDRSTAAVQLDVVAILQPASRARQRDDRGKTQLAGDDCRMREQAAA